MATSSKESKTPRFKPRIRIVMICDVRVELLSGQLSHSVSCTMRT